ncbi:hypothetical protein BGZ60DRAFT_566403 [Tricladium varicosporioides]|nr:hypothetical protein BGZ60DRAFT_566403 [Hymenoscyphus varicosporioides]
MVQKSSLLLAGAILASSVTALDFGSCQPPQLTYDKTTSSYGTLAKSQYAGQSPSKTMKTITDYLCKTLEGSCDALTEANILCTNAASAAAKKTGQDAANAFNDVIKAGMSKTDSSPRPPPKKIFMSMTKDFVTFDGNIDPVWWFNNKIEVTNDACDETQHSMPGSRLIQFKCHGDVPGETVPAMRAVLNALATDQRFFKHFNKTETYCKVVSAQNGCAQMDSRVKYYTSFPRTMSMYAKSGTWDQGGLTFEITKSESAWDCMACKLAGAGMALTSIMAPYLEPIMAGAAVAVEISCATSGC